jgi:hypothetical protein
MMYQVACGPVAWQYRPGGSSDSGTDAEAAKVARRPDISRFET